MATKGVYEFYSEALVPLSPRAELVPLLKAVIAGGETTKDFVWALRNDHELQAWLRQTVVTMGFEATAQGLEAVITLIGQDRVRDILLGRSIERAFVAAEDTLMAKHRKGAKKKEGDDAAGEAPPIAEFINYLNFAKKSEEVANAIRNSYPWQAYVGGLLYDYLNYYLKSRKVETVKGLTRPDLLNSKVYVETLFSEGLRSAIASLEVLQQISIKHQKNVFIASLLQNCGKIIQFGFDPLAYQTLLNDQEQRHSLGISANLLQDEAKRFPFDTGQVNSLFVGRLPFLQDIDKVLDYAGAPKILRMRDSNLYALHCVLRIGSDLAKLFQLERSGQPDVQKMNDEALRKSEEYSFLKLNADEWKSVKSNFALKIMKAGL